MLTAALENEHVLVSYADVVRRPRWWRDVMRPALERGAFASAMLDSGAFTELTERKRGRVFTIDLEAYGRFALAYRDLFTAIVTLDDIASDLERTWRNTAHLEALGLEVIVVVHQGEPWAVLVHYLARYPRVAVGMQRNQRGQLQSGARAWLVEFFERVAGRRPVHGLGLSRFAQVYGFPFASTDSTTWIAEYRGLRGLTDRRPGRGGVALEPGAGGAVGQVAAATDRTHGIGGELADLFAFYTDLELARMAVDSHHAGRFGWAAWPAELGPYRPSQSELDTEWHELIERDSRGQARTALRRFGPLALAVYVNQLDQRHVAGQAELEVAA